MESEKKECAAILFCGDFNGPPEEPFHARLHQLGYRSAHRLRHGREPDYTWPTGIQAPLMDHGPAECLDYVYIWADERYEVRVTDAAVWGKEPSPRDKTLFPSDHAAVKASLEIRRRAPAASL